MTWILKDTENNATVEFSTKAKAEDKRDELTTKDTKGRFEIVDASTDGTQSQQTDNSADRTETPAQPPEPVETDTQTTEVVEPVEQLAKDPIKWLEGQNSSFVNTIKGTPAISKQGFRFIQSKFGIVTESEIVHTFDDPTGVIVWAKAELPDGQYAEAHGEGYLFEDKVDDNEFVRYADTRAKNRAISDLTSAGALAVSELGGEQ
jgi:hypothetical protein